MAEGLASGVVNFIGIVTFILLLPFLVAALFFVPGLSRENIWFIKLAFTLLGPFSTTLWYIILHRVVTRQRSSYLAQLVVFMATELVIYRLLWAGVYSLRM